MGTMLNEDLENLLDFELDKSRELRLSILRSFCEVDDMLDAYDAFQELEQSSKTLSFKEYLRQIEVEKMSESNTAHFVGSSEDNIDGEAEVSKMSQINLFRTTRSSSSDASVPTERIQVSTNVSNVAQLLDRLRKAQERNYLEEKGNEYEREGGHDYD